MPTYRVQDPNTGRTIKLEGNSPPTEQELNQIFSTVGSSPQKRQSKQTDFIDSLLGALPGAGAFVGGAVGGLGGGLGGTLAGPLGTVGGGIAGAGVGGGLGYSGGRIIKESLQDLLGRQDESPLEKVGSTLKGSAYAGAGSAVGQAGGELLGAVARPIGKKIFEIGAHVPKAIQKKLVEKSVSNIDEFVKLSDQMLEKNISGTPKNWIKLANKFKNQAWDDVGKAASNLGDQPVATFNDLASGLNQGLDNAPLGNPKQLKKAFADLSEDIINRFGTEYTTSDLIEINKFLNKSLWSKTGSKTTSEGAIQLARDSIDDFVRDTIYKVSPEAGSALQEYGIYKNIERVGADVLSRTGKFPSSIQRIIDTIFANPTLDTTLGRGLYNTGNALPGLGAGTSGALGSYLNE